MFNIYNLCAVITMALNLSSWKVTLPVMVFGMVGIFLVIGVVILATYALNKIFSRKKKDKDNDNK